MPQHLQLDLDAALGQAGVRHGDQAGDLHGSNRRCCDGEYLLYKVAATAVIVGIVAVVVVSPFSFVHL